MATRSLFGVVLAPAITHADCGGADPCEEYTKRAEAAQPAASMGVRLEVSVRQAVTLGLKWALWLVVSSVVTMPPVFAQYAVEPWVEWAVAQP